MRESTLPEADYRQNVYWAEQFEVSRPTIREAIIALEVRDRVEVKTSSGVYVLDKPSDTNQDTCVERL